VNLDLINAYSETDAQAAFLGCCGATRWAKEMTARRPFTSDADVHRAAADVWASLTPGDWLEAFAAHPKIGDLEGLRAKFGQGAAWSAQEQRGVGKAGEAILTALADGNRRYEDRFGHIFIVCATGKSAAEMLALLEHRLRNDREAELRVAAAEQEKITRLRLEMLGT
jgi:2-oxo-4-hydroxy-4-carboxy-5-ureidoimidazoline decarboxylase